MSRRSRAIREAIVATLLRVDGTGDYVNDLTATGSQPARVQSGKWQRPPLALSAATDDAPGRPFVGVYNAGIERLGGPDSAHFTHRGTWILTGFVEGNPKIPESKLAAAEDLLDDLLQALCSNLGLYHESTALAGFGAPTVRNLVDLLEARALPFDDQGEQPQRPGPQHGLVVIAVTASWREAHPTQARAP